MGDSSDEQPATPGRSEGGDMDYTSDDGEGEGDDPELLHRSPQPGVKIKVGPGRKKMTRDATDLVEADLESGFKVVSAMSNGQMNKFLALLDEKCPAMDGYNVSGRMKRIKWDEIAFDCFSGNDCRVAWIYLKHQMRKFRIMHEIIQEIKLASNHDIERFRSRLIESAPGFPKRPPQSAANLFVREMWKANPENHKINYLVFQKECCEGFQKLDASTQQTWHKKLENISAEYEEQVKQFCAKHPKYNYKQSTRNKVHVKKVKVERPPARPRFTTGAEQLELFPDAPKPPSNPQAEYVQYRLSNLDTMPTGAELTKLKKKYTEKYQRLSDSKKYNWIQYVLEAVHQYSEELESYQAEHPDYITRPIKLRSYLSKADIDNWAHMNCQPDKPALNVFDYFWKEKCNETEYADLSEKQSRRLAEQEFKGLDAYDKEICRMNFRRGILEYKKSIEKFFDWTPDILKPHILYRIPKKFQSVVLAKVEKLPVSMLLEEEEKAELLKHQDEAEEENYDDEEDPLAIPEPPLKKKKKAKLQSDQSFKSEPPSPKKKKLELEHEVPLPSTKAKKKRKHSTSEAGNDDDIIVYVDEDKIFNGRSKDKAHSHKKDKHKSHNKDKEESAKMKIPKPSPTDYLAGLLPTTHDINEVIRGIFDARAQIGRSYSVFYYYAKYVAREAIWIRRVESFGLVDSAKKIFDTFLGLSTHKKDIFIHQSYEFHEQAKHTIPKSSDAITTNMLFPGEPVKPSTNAMGLYNREMKKWREQKGIDSTPMWSEIGEESQHLYMKKLYQSTKQYYAEYEEYLMKLTPAEFAAYTLFQTSKWERRVLSVNSRHRAWRSFIFPLPTNSVGKRDSLEESDTETIESNVYRARYTGGKRDKHRLHDRPPCVLDNDDYIQRLTKTVTPEQLSTQELMDIADESDES